jgi:AraC-like DNA-binding protein/mannose-6-phosphate isomerase-like protein (cupin superfamily)
MRYTESVITKGSAASRHFPDGEKKAWQQKEEFGFSFPFRCWDSTLPEFVYPAHWHEYYEVFIVLEGKVDVVIEGTVHNTRKGDIVSIDPGRVHSFPSSEAGAVLRLFHFERRIFADEDHSAGINRDGNVFFHKPLIRAGTRSSPESRDEVLYTRVYGILAELFTEFREKKAGFRLAIKAGLYLMALAHIRDRLEESPAGLSQKSVTLMTDKRLEKVYLLIYRDFNNPKLDLNRAAREAALSRFHFARYFKRQTGRGFYAFLSMVRLSHAKDMLLKTDMPGTEIALECGFASLPTFYRVFRADTGLTPGAYREKLKEQ